MINYNVFSFIMLNLIMGYANSKFIITVKLHWFIPLYSQVFQDDFQQW